MTIRVTYTWGLTPESVIRERLPDEYHMILTAGDRAAAMTALRKVRGAKRIAAQDAYNELFYEGHSVGFEKRKMMALLDGLGKLSFSRDRYARRAASLRSSILETLNIEEI